MTLHCSLARSFASDAIDFDAIERRESARDLPQEIEIRVRDLAIFASGRKQACALVAPRRERVLCAFAPWATRSQCATLRRANIQSGSVCVRSQSSPSLSLSRLRLISKERRRGVCFNEIYGMSHREKSAELVGFVFRLWWKCSPVSLLDLYY
jgi:hypothetical protein